MFNEVRTEIAQLSQDFRFIRNLSLTFIIAIASLLVLSDWQAQTTQASEQAEVSNLSYSSNKFTVEHK